MDAPRAYSTRLREETLTGPKKRTPECCGMPATAKTAALNGSTALLQLDGERKQNNCIGRESNPGRPRGRRAFYH